MGVRWETWTPLTWVPPLEPRSVTHQEPDSSRRRAACWRETVEADGAKRLPLKAHAPHEPVIPPNTRQTIYVVGADGFGRPIRQICHRPERYAALCGAAENDVVTPTLEAAVLRAEGYAGGWVYVNKVETPQDWRNAEALAALLPGKVVAGSLWERRYRTIS